MTAGKKPGIGLISKIKILIMKIYLKQWLAQLLEKFKAKNSLVWGAIVSVATVLQFGIAALIPGLPAGFLSLEWILHTLNVSVSADVLQWVLWGLVAITGAKTTPDLPDEQREQKIAESQAKIKEKEQRKAERQQKKADRKG